MQSYDQGSAALCPNNDYRSSAGHNSNNEDEFNNLYFGNTSQAAAHELEIGDHVQMQVESSESSTSSSPQRYNTGNRLRSLSLNTKNMHYRSTAHVTQQQINKKRQRATPEQLNVLEDAFACNPSPNARMRENISNQINMTERSVQIWFQNRRAKIKLLHRKSGPEEIIDQATSTIRPGLPERSYSIDTGLYQGHGSTFMEDTQEYSTGLVTRLNCRSLTIGTWRRVACTSHDLVCYFSNKEPRFTYYISSGSTGFKIEFPLKSIINIDLSYIPTPNTKEMGRAIVSLSSSPIFFMELSSSGVWKQCTDFTENQQGTNVLLHAIVGPYQHLKQSLARLTVIHNDIQNRITIEDIHNEGISQESMISSVEPSEQYLATSNSQHNDSRPVMLPFTPETLRESARGSHRRTRSRSAPIAVDFSWLNHGHSIDTPGYISGQNHPSMLARQTYGGIPTPVSQAMSLDCSDEFYSPSVPTPSCYADTWYASSYANTPLLDTSCSRLGSPMLAGGAHFDIPLVMSQVDPYMNFTEMRNTTGTIIHSLPEHTRSVNLSMPDLPHLDSVPEIPVANQEQYSLAESFQALISPPCMAPQDYLQDSGQLPPG